MKPVSLLAVCLAIYSILAAQSYQQINECVIENGTLKKIMVDYNPGTGQKTIVINGIRKDFDSLQRNSKEYASGSSWYINNEELVLAGASYEKYGLPRILEPGDVTRFATQKGIGIYAEGNASGAPEMIYIPVQHGCEFQPYQKKLPECGTASISLDKKQFKAGESLTLTANVTGASQALSYDWSVSFAEIKGKTNQQQIVIIVPQKETVDVYVYITGPRCASGASAEIKPAQ